MYIFYTYKATLFPARQTVKGSLRNLVEHVAATTDLLQNLHVYSSNYRSITECTYSHLRYYATHSFLHDSGVRECVRNLVEHVPATTDLLQNLHAAATTDLLQNLHPRNKSFLHMTTYSVTESYH